MGTLTVLWAEVYRELMEGRRSGVRFSLALIIQAAAFVGCWYVFLALNPLGPSAPGRLERVRSLLLVGYVVWTYAVFALNGMGREVSAEVSSGSLQQRLAAGPPAAVVMAGRALGHLLVSLMYSSTLFCLLIVVTRVKLLAPVSIAPVLFLALAGVYGLGYILAGVALVWRNVNPLTYAALALMLCLGVLPDPARLGHPLLFFSEFLPLTAGVRALRGLMVDQATLGALWADGTLPLLLLNSAFYVLAGLAAFQAFHELARRKGTLGGV